MMTMLQATRSYRPSWGETVQEVAVVGVVRPSGRAVPLYSLHCWALGSVAVAAGAPAVDQQQEQPRPRPTSVPLVQPLKLPLLPARRICWVLKSVNS